MHAIKDMLPLGGRKEAESHAREALHWIYRAQDAAPDRGVSHSFQVGKGWAASYPETTGYIIPTLLNRQAVTGEEEALTRALDMARWESSMQLESGAVIGSVVGQPDPKPVVFNTGQVIFGWVAAYRSTGEKRYLESAVRAADWLVAALDNNGTWSAHGNLGKDAIHTYNIRVAWAVLELWKITGNESYRKAMARFVEWALSQEAGRGWFHNNCLNENDRPLLHTIAYTSQGLLESGLILDDKRAIDAAIRTSEELLKQVSNEGRMPGRYTADWTPGSKWSCLTGMAQSAIVWQRLNHLCGDKRFLKAASDVNSFLMRTQDISTADPGVRGGIKGSFPINGGYGTYRMLNWAAKFFLDSMLLELNPGLQASPGYYQG